MKILFNILQSVFSHDATREIAPNIYLPCVGKALRARTVAREKSWAATLAFFRLERSASMSIKLGHWTTYSCHSTFPYIKHFYIVEKLFFYTLILTHFISHAFQLFDKFAAWRIFRTWEKIKHKKDYFFLLYWSFIVFLAMTHLLSFLAFNFPHIKFEFLAFQNITIRSATLTRSACYTG